MPVKLKNRPFGLFLWPPNAVTLPYEERATLGTLLDLDGVEDISLALCSWIRIGQQSTGHVESATLVFIDNIERTPLQSTYKIQRGTLLSPRNLFLWMHTTAGRLIPWLVTNSSIPVMI